MPSPAPIVTLTTDWHRDDFYAGLLLGHLLRIAPNARIIPISQHITHHNSIHAAFVLRLAYTGFAPGTVHLCMVGSENCKTRRMLVFELDGHWFVLPDNGMVGMLSKVSPPPPRAFAMSNGSFGALQAATEAIAAINVNRLEEYPVVHDFKIQTGSEAAFTEHSITGKIVYIDSYGNAITNISRQLFEMVGRNRTFEIPIIPGIKIEQIVQSYHEIEAGDLLALFNSAGLLEIAINMASLATMYSKAVNDSVTIQFSDNNFSLTTP